MATATTDWVKKRRTVQIVIQVTIESDLPNDEMIDEFQSECNYEIPSTENVTVIETEWLETK